MKALIIGNGASGKSASKLMKKLGYDTFVIDEKRVKLTNILINKLLSGLDILILSPGVSIFHPLVLRAKALNIETVGELEIGSRFLSCKSIAITGTNGKTTTVSLVSKLLENGQRKVFVGGNIGIAVSSFCMLPKASDSVVLEVSSFQLESILHFHPHIAVLLNITPDHLNRHKTMENYVQTKFRIFENQTSKDFAVLNFDDKIICEQDISSIKSEIYYFSTKNECKGCYCKNGSIYFSDGVVSQFVMRISDISLSGEHNLSNVLAGLLCAILSQEPINLLSERVKSFKGISHRLEFVSEINGVTFINDSKATNISSTLVAIKAMTEQTTLIVGGSDKGFDFDELFDNFSPLIKNVVVIGETKEKILTSAKKFNISNVFVASTFKEAVYIAYNLSSANEVVLLSPASASFDMFKNFEQRGRVFIKIVREIEKIENRKVRGKKTKKIQD